MAHATLLRLRALLLAAVFFLPPFFSPWTSIAYITIALFIGCSSRPTLGYFALIELVLLGSWISAKSGWFALAPPLETIASAILVLRLLFEQRRAFVGRAGLMFAFALAMYTVLDFVTELRGPTPPVLQTVFGHYVRAFAVTIASYFVVRGLSGEEAGRWLYHLLGGVVFLGLAVGLSTLRAAFLTYDEFVLARGTGPYDPNFALSAAVMTLAVGAGYHSMLPLRPSSRTYSLILYSTGTLAAILSAASRTSLLALAALVGSLIITQRRFRLLLLLAVTVLVLLAPAYVPPASAQRLAELRSGLPARGTHYQDALSAISERPFLGWGRNAYFDPEYGRTAHNSLLHNMAEGGVIFGLAWATLILLPLLATSRLQSDSRKIPRVQFRLLTVVYFVASMGLTLVPFRNLPGTMYLVASAVVVGMVDDALKSRGSNDVY